LADQVYTSARSKQVELECDRPTGQLDLYSSSRSYTTAILVCPWVKLTLLQIITVPWGKQIRYLGILPGEVLQRYSVRLRIYSWCKKYQQKHKSLLCKHRISRHIKISPHEAQNSNKKASSPSIAGGSEEEATQDTAQRKAKPSGAHPRSADLGTGVGRPPLVAPLAHLLMADSNRPTEGAGQAAWRERG